MGEVTALVQRPDANIALPTVSAQALVQGLEAYREIQRALDKSMPEQIMTLDGKPFRKKGYWRAVALAFNVNVELIAENYIPEDGTFQDGKGNFGWSITCKATHLPTGRSQLGDGACFAIEKARRNDDRWKSLPFQATQHNVRSHAHTRAYNRAVSNLVGFGEVSAEEVEHSEESSTSAPVVRGRSAGPTPTPATPLAAQDAPGTALVKAVEVKSGSKNGKPWTRYAITLMDGTVLSTFDKKLGERAQEAREERRPVIVTWSAGAKGNDLQMMAFPGPHVTVAPQAPDEPVDGPEKALTGRVMTMADGRKAWVLQTSKRQMYTEDEQLAQGFKVARSDGLGIVPTLKGSWTSPDGTVMARLVKLVVWHPPATVTSDEMNQAMSEALAELRQPVEEFTREPGDDD